MLYTLHAVVYYIDLLINQLLHNYFPNLQHTLAAIIQPA
jgi:hypothetical protein